MEFTPNTMVGHYRLVEKIGEGGMGVVWRAVDTSLEREVAIKFLPDLFAEDPDRLARFDREAKLLASLNHPGIATIHGLHHDGAAHFLAMELVPGADLSRRLADGPLPVDEALGIALKIAEALEAAHESGVIHRDLKPANIQITPDGQIKILDFGLAKALQGESPGGSGASLSPTLTTPAATRAGLILGTAAYMSPEQAKGKPVDRRADIWAFGCILYEMLAGRRPFSGEGVSELIAAVIMAPVEMDALPSATPPRIRRLVHRCLERDPRRRLRDIGEARLLLEEALSGAAEEPLAAVATSSSRPARSIVAWVAGTALVAALATVGVTRFLLPHSSTPPVRRFEIAARGPFRSSVEGRLVAVSPDGQSVAYVDEGKLFLRPVSRLEARGVATAAPPELIFWSPDSAWIGYVAAGKIWKAPAAGGESLAVADIPGEMTGGAGASWCTDDRIVLSLGEASLYTVSARGGDFEEILKVDPKIENDFHQPWCLPGGRGVIFSSHRKQGRPDTLVLLAGGKRRDLLRIDGQDIWFPLYSPTGHILYRRQPSNSGIWALPFSLARLEVTGEPFLVAPDGDVPSVSSDGTLVHVKGGELRLAQLVWMDRTGKVLSPIGAPQQEWPFPELSPDGVRVAVAAKEKEISDIWIHDTGRGTHSRLSAGAVPYSSAGWSPDGSRLVYSGGNGPPFSVMIKSADGGDAPKTLAAGWGGSISADGKYVLYANPDPDTDWDLWYLEVQGNGKPISLLKAPGIQVWPRLSPDGKLFVYASDEGGSTEIYLKRFPRGDGKWQVSDTGGYWPRWNRKGDHLYYVRGDTVMEVDVTTQPEVRLSPPRPVFTRKPLGWSLILGWPPGFDVSPGEERFVVPQPVAEKQENGGIVVVENWLGEFSSPGK
jgi:hypothetical protein